MVRKNPKRKQKICGTDLESELKSLEKMNYAVFGKHSAVQICHWTKSALRGCGHCWKEELYGISSAGCVQMTPAVLWCEHNCVHCWRPLEKYKGSDILKDAKFFDKPKDIIDGILEKRREILMGFKGSKNLDEEAFEKAMNPKLFTMSLSGEPTLYPYLGEMFKEIRKRGAVSFLVTNGLNPEVIRNFKDDEFPTQLVISTNAPNEKLYKIWHRSREPRAWEKFNESLELMRKLKGKTRTSAARV
ncbi:4-demethylwyosine synthase TYW1 [Candidatus Pacearchaeota archaeon]|nr:MAG: 4-demethylwyosine synthase TYW1 [Candidatus Pacearchaeota archaeon]